jgi:hypothetical protein
MKRFALFAVGACCILMSLTTPSYALYGDPPNDTHPWAVHDMLRPRPAVVTPGTGNPPEQPGKAPSDAVVLFDGKDLSNWVAADDTGSPTKWIVVDNAMQPVEGAGDIRSKQEFGDCQLHVEWATPAKAEGNSQGRGNSGVFFMGIYEVQVLDSYQNETYADGQAASIYGQNPPMVNVCRAPGEWQSYDIIFRRPVFADGKIEKPATVTVLQNGVLVQDHWVFEGTTLHCTRSRYEPHGDKAPLKLQDHGNPTRYRNIWIRELPPRNPDGTVGPHVSKEAVAAKRKELAETVRAKAEKLIEAKDNFGAMMTFLESLQYEVNDEAVKKSETLFADYMKGVKKLKGKALEEKKGEILGVMHALRFVTRPDFHILPDTFGPKTQLEEFVAKKKLEEKK